MSAPHLIVSCSLDANSRSALLAARLEAELLGREERVEHIDLRDVALPFCDAASCYSAPNVLHLQEAIGAATSVTLAVPIYNYDVGGATRNLLAVTGRCWTGKTVGFLCAAGGRSSYMAVMGVANSLMLDFRCLIVPRFVYATRDDFGGASVTEPSVIERVGELADELVRLASALSSPSGI